MGTLFLLAELVLCSLPPASSAQVQPELAGHGAAAWQLKLGTSPGGTGLAQGWRGYAATIASNLTVYRVVLERNPLTQAIPRKRLDRM